MLPFILLFVASWQADLNAAIKEARQSDRMLLIDYRADWCAPCNVMDTEVYTGGFLATAAKRFVTVRIDYDRQRAVARKYNVEELPTVIFTDSFGGELLRHTGTMTAQTMAKVIEALPPDSATFNRYRAVLAHDRNNPEALRGMGTALRTAGLFVASNNYFARALNQRGADKAEILTQTGLNYLSLRQGPEAAAIFRRCLREFPTSPLAPQWKARLTEANRP